MFLRIDTDLFINVNNVFSYKLYDEGDSYKLIVWGCDGKIIHSVFYMKHKEDQMNILKEVVNNFRELTINPDISIFREEPSIPEDEDGVIEDFEPFPTREERRKIKESFHPTEDPMLGEPLTNVDSSDEGPRQLSIFDYEENGEE